MHWLEAVLLGAVFIIYVIGLLAGFSKLRSIRGWIIFQAGLNLILVLAASIILMALDSSYYLFDYLKESKSVFLARVTNTSFIFLFFQIVYFLPSKFDLKPPRKEAVIYGLINVMLLLAVIGVSFIIELIFCK